MGSPVAPGQADGDAQLPDGSRRVTASATGTLTVAEAGGLSAEAFAERFAEVFEHSPWVARAAWPSRPWTSVDALHAALVAVVDEAPAEQRLALLRGHPDLARGAGGGAGLTDASAAEQAAAGLDDLDKERGERLAALNRDYRARFGLPFIVCAREHTPASILSQAELRLGHEPAVEERTALAEVAKIARLRLDAMLTDEGRAT